MPLYEIAKKITKKGKTRGKIKHLTKKTNKYKQAAHELKKAVTEKNVLESLKSQHEGEIKSVSSQQKLAKEGIAKLKRQLADIKIAEKQFMDYKSAETQFMDAKVGKTVVKENIKRFQTEINQMKADLKYTQREVVDSLKESPFSKAGKLSRKKLNLKTLENVESHVETTSKEVTKNITEKIKNTEKDITKTNKKTKKLQKLFEKVEAKAEKTNEKERAKLSKYSSKKYATKSKSKYAKYETLEKAVKHFREHPNTNPDTFMQTMESQIATISGLRGHKLEALKRQIHKKVELVQTRVIYERIVSEATAIRDESLGRRKAKNEPPKTDAAYEANREEVLEKAFKHFLNAMANKNGEPNKNSTNFGGPNGNFEGNMEMDGPVDREQGRGNMEMGGPGRGRGRGRGNMEMGKPFNYLESGSIGDINDGYIEVSPESAKSADPVGYIEVGPSGEPASESTEEYLAKANKENVNVENVENVENNERETKEEDEEYDAKILPEGVKEFKSKEYWDFIRVADALDIAALTANGYKDDIPNSIFKSKGYTNELENLKQQYEDFEFSDNNLKLIQQRILRSDKLRKQEHLYKGTIMFGDRIKEEFSDREAQIAEIKKSTDNPELKEAMIKYISGKGLPKEAYILEQELQAKVDAKKGRIPDAEAKVEAEGEGEGEGNALEAETNSAKAETNAKEPNTEAKEGEETNAEAEPNTETNAEAEPNTEAKAVPEAPKAVPEAEVPEAPKAEPKAETKEAPKQNSTAAPAASPT